MEPCRLLAPETKASASTRLVFPLAPCPMTATFRISEPWYSRMVSSSIYGSGKSTDARSLTEPGAQGLVGNIGDAHPRLDGERANRLSGVGDAGKDDRAVGA